MVWLDEVIDGWWLGVDEELREAHQADDGPWWDEGGADRLWVASSALWRAVRTPAPEDAS